MTYFLSLNHKSWCSFPDRDEAMRLVYRTRHRYPTCLITLDAS